MRDIDTLIQPGWIVPVEGSEPVLSDHAVAVDRGEIVAIVPAASAATAFVPRETIRLPRHVLIPGLVNLHTHAAMSLMRGLADDLELSRWLNEHIWPAEAAFVSRDFVYDGTLLACAEMIRSGTTTFQDMYFFPDGAARAALDAGMRAVLGMIVIEFPSAYAGDAAAYLHRGLEIRDAFRAEPRLSFSFGPHAPYTVSDRSFEQILTYAEQLDVPVHMHIHETAGEVERSVSESGIRPLERLSRLGLLGPGLIGVHMVHLSDAEIAALADAGSHMAHCPSSNLKLASGIARVDRLLAAGVNIGIGTDGCASNNRLDLFAEMRLAALLAKGSSGRADVLPALQALTMATLGGARALGLSDRIGSIVAGKRADLVAVDLSSIELEPCYDVVSHLVYAAGREHVTHVWVDGSAVLRERELCTLEARQVAAAAEVWRNRIWQSEHGASRNRPTER